MLRTSARAAVSLAVLTALAGGIAMPSLAATPSPQPATLRAPVPRHRGPAAGHNDYADATFARPLAEGLTAFYARDFHAAQAAFERALLVVPDNTLAISFLNAAAAQQPGALDVLTNVEEDAATGSPRNVVNHVRLGFSYLFQSIAGRDRTQDARDEFNAATALDPDGAAAHVALGIMRFNERSANRSKSEMLAALASDPNNVLAREYLGELYQSDLHDPQRGLTLEIDVPNLVPGYADIDFHIASLLYDLKRYELAAKFARSGLTTDVGHVGEAGLHGYTLLAQIDIDQRRLDEAKRVLAEAIDAGIDTIYARTLLAKIKNGDYDTASGNHVVSEPVTPSPTPR